MLVELLNITTICYLSRDSLYLRVNAGTEPTLSLQFPNFLDSLTPYRFRLHMLSTPSIITPSAAILETDHVIASTTHYFEAWNPNVSLKAVSTYGAFTSPLTPDNRLFSFSKIGYDVMLAEYFNLDSSFCSNMSDVSFVDGPCWFRCYPTVTILKTFLRQPIVNVRNIRGKNVGIQARTTRPVMRDNTKDNYDHKEDEFVMGWYLYRLSEKVSYIANTFYNPKSKRYLATVTRGRRYIFTTMSEKKFHWNNIKRTKMADERFFVQQSVPGISRTYVTFRSHQNLDYYWASRADNTILTRVKPGYVPSEMLFRVTPAKRTPTATTKKPIVARIPPILVKNPQYRIPRPTNST